MIPFQLEDDDGTGFSEYFDRLVIRETLQRLAVDLGKFENFYIKYCMIAC